MFEVAHPSGSVQDVIDGAPVVGVSDTAADISCFLDVLFVSGAK